MSGVGYLFIAGVKETWQIYASKSDMREWTEGTIRDSMP